MAGKMTKCIFCGREFEACDKYDLPRPDAPDDTIEVLMQICPKCLSLWDALREWQ